MVTVRFDAAELAGKVNSDDRIFRTRTAVVLLDGASSHTGDHKITGGEYADRLGEAITARVDDPLPLRSVLRQSIEEVAGALELHSLAVRPSSTVAIARMPDVDGDGAMDLLVLGDSAIVIGWKDGRHELITDDRLSLLGLPETDRYRARLKDGAGYDRQHGEILAELQHAERRYRNRPGGFWIASENPAAADEAISASVDPESVAWLIVATDGVTDVLDSANESWASAAAQGSDGLADLLDRLHRWEADFDPDGMVLPRSKQHDDKAIAVLRFG